MTCFGRNWSAAPAGDCPPQARAGRENKPDTFFVLEAVHAVAEDVAVGVVAEAAGVGAGDRRQAVAGGLVAIGLGENVAEGVAISLPHIFTKHPEIILTQYGYPDSSQTPMPVFFSTSCTTLADASAKP